MDIKKKKKKVRREQDGGGVGGRGVHLSIDTSGIHLQTQKCMHNTAESRQEYLTSGKNL